MITSVSAPDPSGEATARRAAPGPRVIPSVDDQLREASLAMERAKRELAAARSNADRQERRIADARRNAEQARWLAAGSESAIQQTFELGAVAPHKAAIEAAEKARAETASRIERLQSRIERQAARYLDLQTRLREIAELRKSRAASADEAGQTERETRREDDDAPALDGARAPTRR